MVTVDSDRTASTVLISQLDIRSVSLHLLILSPHRDDAALSLGLAMQAWLQAGHRVTVLGVFTRSLHAPFSDADTVHANDLLSYVSAMRRREDAELLKLMPQLNMVDLNLKDAPLRLRCEANDVYSLAADAEDAAIPKIQKALAKIDAAQTIDGVLLPMALGNHVDHLVVRAAAKAFSEYKACAFYEELPDAFRAESLDIPEELEVGLIKCHKAEFIKRRIISVYPSQIDEAAMKLISEHAGKLGGERVWGNAAWSALGVTEAF